MNDFPLFDICLNRHNASATSLDANDRVDKSHWRDEIMKIAKWGPVHLHLLCRTLNKPPNEISPRLSELKERGLLKPNGDRKEGCAVLVKADREMVTV